MRPGPVQDIVYQDYLPNVATAIWTFNGGPGQRAVVRSIYFANNSGADRTVTMRFVPSGGTITNDNYTIVPGVTVTDNQTLYGESDAGPGEDFIRPGESIVAFADAASAIACRICVEII